MNGIQFRDRSGTTAGGLTHIIESAYPEMRG